MTNSSEKRPNPTKFRKIFKLPLVLRDDQGQIFHVYSDGTAHLKNQISGSLRRIRDPKLFAELRAEILKRQKAKISSQPELPKP